MIEPTQKMIKAFLLAGGLGSRLRPLTDVTPKCLLPIQGKPLLQYWLENLATAGVEEVLINTHWLHAQVNQFLERFNISGMQCRTFYEPELLGSAGTLAANLGWVANATEVVVAYADNFTDTQVSDLLTFHRSHAMPVTLGVFRASEPEKCGIVEVNAENIVVSFEEKPKTPLSNLASAGLFVIDPAMFDDLALLATRIGRTFDFGFDVLPGWINQMKIFPVSEHFIDVGTLENYKLACHMFAEEHK